MFSFSHLHIKKLRLEKVQEFFPRRQSSWVVKEGFKSRCSGSYKTLASCGKQMSPHKHLAEMTFVSEFGSATFLSNSLRGPGLRLLVTMTRVMSSFTETLSTILLPHTHQPIWVQDFVSGFWKGGLAPLKVKGKKMVHLPFLIQRDQHARKSDLNYDVSSMNMVWTWAGYLPSLDLGLLIYKLRIMIPIP